MIIEKATPVHWDEIQKIYERARSFMCETGNPHQWKSSYPPKEVLLDDIKSGNLYVILDDFEIQGVFGLFYGQDPTYGYIDGCWLNENEYVTIHRIASAGKKSGILSCALSYAQAQCPNIRIDTHHENKIMQHLLEKLGFTKCGIIYLANGEPRIAYQRNK